MDKNGVFKSYYSRLAKEGFTKALLCGFIVGFSTLLLSALTCWIVGLEWGIWLSLALWVVATAASTPLFYIKRFRPSTKAMARRIDELGLEERLLTMAELVGDESYIAMKQREDAMSSLTKVNEGLLTVVISMPLTIALAIVAFCGIGMTTVSAMYSCGELGSGLSIIGDIRDSTLGEFEIRYEVGDGAGEIEGDDFQLVIEGESSIGVLAVPEDNWVFVEWSDGFTEPFRFDENVQDDATYYAIFAELEEGEGEGEGDGEGEGEGEGEGDGAPGEGEGEGEGNQPGDGQGDGAGGEYEDNSYVYDGKTYYGGSNLEGAKQDAVDNMNQGQYSDAEKGAFSDYFDGISD